MVSEELIEQLARLRGDIIEILERNDVEASLAGREGAIADEMLHCLIARLDLATELFRRNARQKKPD